jgi:hypothetical protein
MELKSERISLALLLVVVIPATVALPFPKTHPTSNFRETIEIVAGLLAKEAEKDFGSGIYILIGHFIHLLTICEPQTV